MLERIEALPPIASRKRRQRAKAAGVRGYLDYETRSCVDLRVVGSYEYAIHPTTEILCMGWAVGAGLVRIWLPGDPWPNELFEADDLGAHGTGFEYLITRFVAHPRHNFPIIPIQRFNCTMARCLAVGYPANLGKAAEAYALQNRKDAAGHRLMLSMTKPRKPRKGEGPKAGPYWHDDPERLQRLYAYCRQDVEVERELDGVVPELSAAERQLWLLDHKLNFEHGFCIDRKLATAAYRIAQEFGPEVDAEIARITDGEICRNRPSQTAAEVGSGPGLHRQVIEPRFHRVLP